MEKKPHITGKDLTPEKREAAQQHLAQRRQEAEAPVFGGEYQKTEEDLALIARIHEALKEKMYELGVVPVVDIQPEQIHFLTHEWYEAFFPNDEAEGKTAPADAAVFIDIDRVRPGTLENFLAHEMTHLAAAAKFTVAGGDPVLTRSGYQLRNVGVKDHEHFRGFNEAITEKISKELTKSLGFKVPPDPRGKTAYEHYIDLVDLIAKRVAEHNHEDVEDVWKRFKRGAFSGEMMHLREVEKVFGKGSLRVLAAIESGNDLPDAQAIPLFKKYFSTDDEEEKESIAEQILNEWETAAYFHRRK